MNDQDRALLERAANAAGYELNPVRELDEVVGFRLVREGRSKEWNPLEDDGDALRLAVKLRIGIGDRETTVTAHHKQFMSVGRVYVEEHDMSDPAAATRRAIVRAAAELAR